MKYLLPLVLVTLLWSCQEANSAKELKLAHGLDVTYGGRLLVIGFATGDIPAIPLNLPLLKSCQIVGVFWGKFLQTFPGEALSNHVQLLEWIAEKKLQPPIQRSFHLSEIQDALTWIADRKVLGKIVLTRENS